LEENDSWTKITTAQGITGWVRKQYLGETPPASSQLKVASRKFAELEETLKSLQDRHSILQGDYEATKGQLETTEEELNNIRSISATHIESYERLQSLAKEIQLLQTENDILKAENESLKLDERTTFFIYGASTLLLGILLAVILPRLRRRRRNNNWAN
jgi:SH3 domain protein